MANYRVMIELCLNSLEYQMLQNSIEGKVFISLNEQKFTNKLQMKSLYWSICKCMPRI